MIFVVTFGCGIGMEVGLGIGNWDWGLGIGDWDWGFGIRNGGLGSGFGIGD